jgi:hypothetical protein
MHVLIFLFNGWFRLNVTNPLYTREGERKIKTLAVRGATSKNKRNSIPHPPGLHTAYYIVTATIHTESRRRLDWLYRKSIFKK